LSIGWFEVIYLLLANERLGLDMFFFHNMYLVDVGDNVLPTLLCNFDHLLLVVDLQPLHYSIGWASLANKRFWRLVLYN
jgi:hypothetical protein